jgi:hypothetical protein
MTSTNQRALRISPPGKLLLGLAGSFLAGNLSVWAAPIKSAHHTAHQVPAQIQAFDNYLHGGPAHWQSSQLMKVPSGVHVRTAGGRLKDNLTVDYVMWVRDRHPITFDRNHPTLGRMLEAAQAEHGTEFFVFTAKHDKATKAESIHAMSTPAATSASTSSLEAQILQSPITSRVLPTPKSVILESSGVSHVFPASRAPVLEAQQIAPETPEPTSVFVTLLLFGSALSWKCWNNRSLRGA